MLSPRSASSPVPYSTYLEVENPDFDSARNSSTLSARSTAGTRQLLAPDIGFFVYFRAVQTPELWPHTNTNRWVGGGHPSKTVFRASQDRMSAGLKNLPAGWMTAGKTDAIALTERRPTVNYIPCWLAGSHPGSTAMCFPVMECHSSNQEGEATPTLVVRGAGSLKSEGKHAVKMKRPACHRLWRLQNASL